MSRTFGEAACLQELDALLAHREKITALDLAGDELGFPGSLFLSHFNRARDAGWHITVHAGEAAGPESIWQAIRELGAERIGHGVKAVEDRALMDFLAQQRIGIESCLTSNIQTSTVASLADHPLKTFLEHGVLASLNTDDPAVQGVDIIHEYHVAAPAAGLSREQIRQAQINGLEIAFLSDSEKRALREKWPRRKIALLTLTLFSACGLMLSQAEKCDISGKTQRRAMFCRFHAQFNQLHNLNRLACRHGIFTVTV